MAEVERLAREQRPKLIIAGWSAYPRQLDFARVPADRRRGRRLPDGGHGALRRAGRRRAAPVAGAARARGHLDHPQDPRRPARRGHPQRNRARPGQEVQLVGVPRPAGRPAGARHRGQGGGVQARRRSRRSASGRRARWRAPGSWPTGCSPTTPARPAIGVVSGGTDVHLVLVDLRDSELDGKQAEDRLHRRRHHGQPQRRARSTPGRRWSAPASGSAPRRWPPAASTTTTSPRSPTSSPLALRHVDRRGRAGRAARPRRRRWPPRHPLYPTLEGAPDE